MYHTKKVGAELVLHYNTYRSRGDIDLVDIHVGIFIRQGTYYSIRLLDTCTYTVLCVWFVPVTDVLCFWFVPVTDVVYRSNNHKTIQYRPVYDMPYLYDKTKIYIFKYDM